MEIMMVVILMALIIGSLYFIFRGGQKGASEAFQNLVINESAQKIVDIVTNDVREANAVEPKRPEMVAPADLGGLKTGVDDHKFLTLKKALFQFAGASPQKCTFNKIEFEVEPEDPRPNAKVKTWALKRTEVPLDANGAEVSNARKGKSIVQGIEDMVFYRIKPDAPDAKGAGAGTIYLKLNMRRTDKDPAKGRYSNDLVTAIKIRGSVPDR